jgi:hypothetical protein
MTELQRRIARARLLRREGKTYAEIRAVVGEVSDDRLATWLAGIPRPAQTRRTHKMVRERREARRMRAAGATYTEIAAELDVSKASLSFWLRDMPVPERVARLRAEHLERIRGSGTKSTKRNAGSRMRARQSVAASAVQGLTPRELFVAGLAVYWSEGAKDKPWMRHGRVKITNSDPDLLRLFLVWLDLVGIREEERIYALSIHESADVATQERWWQDRLMIPAASFRAAVLKRHNPRSVRRNTGDTYHGCLLVEVRRSAALYDAITGWWRGAVGGLDQREPGSCSDMLGSNLPGSSKGRTADFDSVDRGSNPRPGAEWPASAPWLPSRWWERLPPVTLGDEPAHHAEIL